MSLVWAGAQESVFLKSSQVSPDEARGDARWARVLLSGVAGVTWQLARNAECQAHPRPSASESP